RHKGGAFGEASWILALGMPGNVRDPDRTIGASERKATVGKVDVVRLGIEQLGGKRTSPRDHLFGSQRHGGPANCSCARAAVAPPVGKIVGITGAITDRAPG